MVRDKLRIRFRKRNELRLISHHDLMRCFERMLRRAQIPFLSTSGFNPKPRLVFAQSLALGIEGWEEVVELELTQAVPPAEVQARLAREAPAGLEIVSVGPIVSKSAAQVRRAGYRLDVPPDRIEGLRERIALLLAEKHCWIERLRPQPRRVNVRPYLCGLWLEGNVLHMDFWVTPQGSARPSEVLELLGLGDLLAGGAVLQRSLLELEDESACAGATLEIRRVAAPDGRPAFQGR